MHYTLEYAGSHHTSTKKSHSPHEHRVLTLLHMNYRVMTLPYQPRVVTLPNEHRVVTLLHRNIGLSHSPHEHRVVTFLT